MTWQYNTDRERYMRLLREYREQEIPDWDDMDRGILVALVQERPTIWNSGAKFYKDDVMASFQQVTEVLQRKMVNLNVWAVVEKWCWMVEIYIRCTNSSPKQDWRYNSSLAFLEPFNSVKYPYLGSLTMERVLQLTDKFEQKDWLSSEEADKFTFKFPVGLFWDEIGSDGAANLPAANFTRAQVARRRKRNLKSNSPQIIKTSPKPTPPPQEEEEDVKLFDEHGFSHAMYLELIELVKTEAAELWHNTHPRRNDTVSHDVAYASVARQIRGNGPRGDALSGKDVERVWRELAERFYAEEAAADGAKSDWKYFEKLQFLSHRVMPAFLYDSIYLKNNDPSTSQEMTSTSPSPQQQQVSTQKSIQAVLDSILLKNQKNHLHHQQQNMMMGSSQENEIIMSELQKILNNGHVLMSEPPVKKSRRSQSPVEKNQETTTVVVVNDARNCTPTTISTWVPPKEEISSASTSTILTPKEEIIEKPPATKKPSTSSSTVPTTSTTVPPSTTVTAVIRQHASNSQHEKQLRKLTAVQNQHQQNQHSKLITLQNPAIAHALLNKPANMSNGVIGSNNMSNGNSNMSNGQTAKIVVEQEDKWVLLGKLIATSCREIEQRDAILAVHLNKEILEILHKFQIKSLGG